MFSAPFVAEGAFVSTPVFLALLLLHMLCYMPTVGLATATAFHLLKNKEREFPLVRVCGTVGWIAAGIVVSYLLQGDTTALPMHVAGIAGILMGLYSFTLPNVPPPGAGRKLTFRDIVGLDALVAAELTPVHRVHHQRDAHQHSAGHVLCVCARLPERRQHHESCFQDDVRTDVRSVVSVVAAVVLPEAGREMGPDRRHVAWILRYALFALGAPEAVMWMLIAGICLHGPCYDFVYVAGQVYIDRKASPAIRAQAQGLFVLATYGIGQGLGTLAAGWMFNAIMPGASGPSALEQWQTFWIMPLVFAVIVTAMFVAGFREESPARKTADCLEAHVSVTVRASSSDRALGRATTTRSV